MLPDRVSNPGSLTYESGGLPSALRGPASQYGKKKEIRTDTGKTKHEKAGSQSLNTIYHYRPAYKI